MELIRQIVTIYKIYHYKTLVLVASVRHPQHVVEADLAGAAHAGRDVREQRVGQALLQHGRE